MANVIDARQRPASASKVPSPPIDAEFYFADVAGRPCSPAMSHLWTWAKAPTWWRSSEFPPPGGTKRGKRKKA